MKQSDDNKTIPMTSVASGKGHEIAPDVYYYTNQIVNVVFIGAPDQKGWVLVDAGMPHSAEELIKVAEERFGVNKPAAIVLTHGHFDHVGSIVGLLEKWHVPVYAHLLEFPYLTGKLPYPDPDVTVEGGMLAKLSFMYPHKPVDITEALHEIPLMDHGVPHLPGWQWLHTPGHSPGHISLFRESDRMLIAGDAFITVKADSFYKVLMNKTEVNGPPVYLTTDWKAARTSVEKLALLHPSTAITGHGSAVSGDELKKGLARLVTDFDEMAIPDHGKYVKEDDKASNKKEKPDSGERAF